MQPLIKAIAEALGMLGQDATCDAALEGRTGTVYTIPLLLEHDNGAYILDVHTDGPLPAAAHEEILLIAEDVGADGAVLAHLEAAESVASDVVLWGKDDLVRLLGAAALHAATGIDVEPPALKRSSQQSPVAESLDDLLPPAFHRSIVAETPSEPLDFEPFDMDAFEHLGDEPDVEEAPEPAIAFTDMFDGLADAAVADVEPTPVALDTPAAPLFAYPLLPVRMGPDQAKAAVRERLFEVHGVERILQPVHLLDYECDLLAEGSLRYDTVTGRIQVHGTDKTVTEVAAEVVDPAGFSKAVPEVPASERTLRISDDRAKELGRHFLAEAHTRVVDVSVDDKEGSFDFTEKKKVAPRPDHIRLAHLGTFHRIIWRVRGPNGHVDIDAITGDAVEQVLRTPDPGVYIMD